MRPFHFSLEQVLRYRAQLEERAMLAFAGATRARDKRLREKIGCEREIEKSRAKLADITALDADERWLISRYINALAYDLERAVRDIAVLEEELDRCRDDLMQRARDRKLLEKLKEKQAERHVLVENHKERQNYDDIATIRFTPSTL